MDFQTVGLEGVYEFLGAAVTNDRQVGGLKTAHIR